MIEELPIPDSVLVAKAKLELARIWLVDGDQVTTLTPRLWDDPGAWGLMLVDLARHVAKAYEAQGHDAKEALERVKAAFDAEWSNPSS